MRWPLLAGLALVIATASVLLAHGERLWVQRFGADSLRLGLVGTRSLTGSRNSRLAR
jgi:hypothetical protein